MNDFLSTSGHGFYLWGAYGMCAVAMALEPWLVLCRQRQARHAAAAFVADDANDANEANKA